MKLVYSNENRFLVSHAKNLLELAGIELVVKNEYAAGAVGDLSPFDAWMELWLRNDGDEQEARALIKSAFNTDIGPDWRCAQCQEMNGAAFAGCWQCQARKS
jgi:hypothetical protein